MLEFSTLDNSDLYFIFLSLAQRLQQRAGCYGFNPAAQQGEFQHCMISDPKSPAGQPQQINNGLMDLVLLINLCGIGKHWRTVSL